MTFQTPVSSGRDQPQVSLLFTPVMKSAEGKAHSPAFGRTQTVSTPVFGSSPMGSIFGTADGAPMSTRRRSLTPASSTAKETPPPPPSESLMDSPGLVGPSMDSWRGRAGVGDTENMAISPVEIADGRSLSLPAEPEMTTSVREFSAAGQAFRNYESNWVTVYGFNQGDVPLVLREFGRCGDILRYGTFDDGPQVNWMHIKYSNKHSAQRALLRSGDQLSATCMIGVKPVDNSKIEALERATTSTGRESVDGQIVPSLKPVQPSRTYHLNASSAPASIVPLSSRSTWQKVSEFILGL